MSLSRLEIYDDDDYVGGGGGVDSYFGGAIAGRTLFVDDYTPTEISATKGELWMSFVNQPSKAPFKIGDVVAGQIVQIPLAADEPVRLYLISHDELGRRISIGFANAQTITIAPNKEFLIPVITQNGAAGNATINFIASNYSEKTKFRKIQFADNANFTTNLVEMPMQSFSNQQGVMDANFAITRTGDLTNTKTVYVRIAHSSNNINFDKWSPSVQATFANSGGGGGGGGGNPPPSEAPPSNLTLSESGGVVTLNWQNNNGSGANVVERNINNGGWAELTPDLAASATTTTDTPNVPGTNLFTYRVKNRNVTGYSNEQSVTITVSGGGGSAPTNFNSSQTAISSTQVRIDLIWDSNSGTGNNLIDRRISPDDPWVNIASLAAGVESYSDTVNRETVNRIYYYRLSNSLIAEFRYTEQTVVMLGSNPINLVNVSSDEFIPQFLQWENRGATGTNIIERQRGAGPWFEVANALATETSATDEFPVSVKGTHRYRIYNTDFPGQFSYSGYVFLDNSPF